MEPLVNKRHTGSALPLIKVVTVTTCNNRNSNQRYRLWNVPKVGTRNNRNTIERRCEHLKIVAIANQKGGCGKSASAAALIAGLRRAGLSVLAVDTDPQANLSMQMGATLTDATLADVFMETTTAAQAIQQTAQGAIIPACGGLADKSMLSGKWAAYALVKPLQSVANRFDVAIVDTPPNIGALTIAALTACSGVIIPAVCDRFSIDAIRQTTQSIEAVRDRTNNRLKVLGILPTLYQRRLTVHQLQLSQMQQTAAELGAKVYTPIRYCAVVQESQFMGTSVFDARRNVAADDYQLFVNDVLTDLENI